MTNVIIDAVQAAVTAAGGMPGQVQLGMAAGGIVIGIIGGVIGWFGYKRKAHNVSLDHSIYDPSKV